YKPVDVAVTIENGVTARPDVALVALPGKVVVSVNATANCTVDSGGTGEARPELPATPEAPSGARQVACRRSGYDDYSMPVEVRPGRAVLVKALLEVSRGGETRIEARSGLEFVRMPAGTFVMGCPTGASGCQSNEPRHNVTLSSFWVGKTKIT